MGTSVLTAAGVLTPASYPRPATGGGTGTVQPASADGRLTLESGVPISVTAQIGQSTVYYTPYLGDHISLYTGAVWADYTFTERSLALSGLTSGKNYDVFLQDVAGTLTLSLSAAWTTNTARAAAISRQDGVWVLDSDHTKRLLGTIRTTGTTTTEDSAGGTSGSTGGKRFVWNVVNRVPRPMSVFDATAFWTYTTQAWRPAHGNAGNACEYVCGLNDEPVQVFVSGSTSIQQASGSNAQVGVGVDSQSTPSGYGQYGFTNGAAFINVAITASYHDYPGLGYHTLYWLEFASDGISSVFLGSNTNAPCGLLATVLA